MPPGSKAFTGLPRSNSTTSRSWELTEKLARLGSALDRYMRRIEDDIRQSALTDPLKTQILSNLDIVTYKDFSVVRIRVPRQTQISFVGDDCFIRIGSSTHLAKGPQIAAVSASFPKG